jgi:hypothetical protein
VYYLIALLGEEIALVELLRNKPPSKGRHWFPLNWCIRPWTMGHEFLRKCKVGVLQYVIVKNLMAITIIVLENLSHRVRASRHACMHACMLRWQEK